MLFRTRQATRRRSRRLVPSLGFDALENRAMLDGSTYTPPPVDPPPPSSGSYYQTDPAVQAMYDELDALLAEGTDGSGPQVAVNFGAMNVPDRLEIIRQLQVAKDKLNDDAAAANTTYDQKIANFTRKRDAAKGLRDRLQAAFDQGFQDPKLPGQIDLANDTMTAMQQGLIVQQLKKAAFNFWVAFQSTALDNAANNIFEQNGIMTNPDGTQTTITYYSTPGVDSFWS